MWDEELDVAGCPEVTEACAAEVADEADVGDEDAGYDDQDEGGCPGGDLVRSDTTVGLVDGRWEIRGEGT